MEISNYYVPVALILPIIAILGLLFVTLASTYVLRRKRRRRSERDSRHDAGQSAQQNATNDNDRRQ